MLNVFTTFGLVYIWAQIQGISSLLNFICYYYYYFISWLLTFNLILTTLCNKKGFNLKCWYKRVLFDFIHTVDFKFGSSSHYKLNPISCWQIRILSGLKILILHIHKCKRGQSSYISPKKKKEMMNKLCITKT